MAMRDSPTSLRPKRGYQLLVASWIAGISLFVGVRIAIDRQFTFGEPDGVLVTAGQHPLLFWSGVAIPCMIGLSMIVVAIRGELRHRAALRAYQQQLQDEKVG